MIVKHLYTLRVPPFSLPFASLYNAIHFNPTRVGVVSYNTESAILFVTVVNKSSNSVKSKQAMSKKLPRSCKYQCTDCRHIWFNKDSKEPSLFARMWPRTCEICERKQKTERERAAKEEKKKEEKAIISKRNEVQQAKVKLHQRIFEAEEEFLNMKLEVYEGVPEDEDKEVQKKVFKIVEELEPIAAPDLKPEKFSKTQPKTEEDYHEQMIEAEMRLKKIELLQKGFEANRKLLIFKLEKYKKMKMNVDLLDKISNLKIQDIAAGQGSESAPTQNDSTV